MNTNKIIWFISISFLIAGTVMLAEASAQELEILGENSFPDIVIDLESIQFSNQTYGEMYIFDEASGHMVVIPIEDEFYNLTDFESTRRHRVNFDGNESLVIVEDGTYAIEYSISFAGGGSDLYGVAVLVNGEVMNNTYIHRKLGAAGDVGNAGGTGILDLKQGDILNLGIEDEAAPGGADDADINMANLKIFKLETEATDFLGNYIIPTNQILNFGDSTTLPFMQIVNSTIKLFSSYAFNPQEDFLIRLGYTFSTIKSAKDFVVMGANDTAPLFQGAEKELFRINGTSGDVNISEIAWINGSQVCTADNGICAISGDNSSWNQSLANDLYINQGGDEFIGDYKINDTAYIIFKNESQDDIWNLTSNPEGGLFFEVPNVKLFGGALNLETNISSGVYTSVENLVFPFFEAKQSVNFAETLHPNSIGLGTSLIIADTSGNKPASLTIYSNITKINDPRLQISMDSEGATFNGGATANVDVLFGGQVTNGRNVSFETLAGSGIDSYFKSEAQNNFFRNRLGLSGLPSKKMLFGFEFDSITRGSSTPADANVTLSSPDGEVTLFDIDILTRLVPNSTANPCNIHYEGALYYDDDLHKPLYCNSTNFVTFDGGTFLG